MSESDSFIDEVTDEVRRDRLFKLFKKYAWILVLAVVAIVGGTAYVEWDKSNTRAEARLTGDVMLAAIAANDSAALDTRLLPSFNRPISLKPRVTQLALWQRCARLRPILRRHRFIPI